MEWTSIPIDISSKRHSQECSSRDRDFCRIPKVMRIRSSGFEWLLKLAKLLKTSPSRGRRKILKAEEFFVSKSSFFPRELTRENCTNLRFIPPNLRLFLSSKHRVLVLNNTIESQHKKSEEALDPESDLGLCNKPPQKCSDRPREIPSSFLKIRMSGNGFWSDNETLFSHLTPLQFGRHPLLDLPWEFSNPP